MCQSCPSATWCDESSRGSFLLIWPGNKLLGWKMQPVGQNKSAVVDGELWWCALIHLCGNWLIYIFINSFIWLRLSFQHLHAVLKPTLGDASSCRKSELLTALFRLYQVPSQLTDRHVYCLQVLSLIHPPAHQPWLKKQTNKKKCWTCGFKTGVIKAGDNVTASVQQNTSAPAFDDVLSEIPTFSYLLFVN